MSPHTPARSSTGGEVTKEEVELLINHSLSALSSTHKNTTLGDTCFKCKGSPADASASSDVEESLVDSTTEGRQDDNKSNQGSPVSVKDAPDKSAPSNE